MAVRETPSAECIRSAFDYEPDSGALRWKARATCPSQWNTRWAGKLAGSLDSKGYIGVKVNWQRYRAHHVVWCFVYGAWPTAEIDHINGDRSDNRIANLRLADHSENGCNRKMQRNNTSGFKGVSWHSGGKRWLAQIVVDGQHTNLGLFSDPRDAHAAYCRAAQEQHGVFANTGRA